MDIFSSNFIYQIIQHSETIVRTKTKMMKT